MLGKADTLTSVILPSQSAGLSWLDANHTQEPHAFSSFFLSFTCSSLRVYCHYVVFIIMKRKTGFCLFLPASFDCFFFLGSFWAVALPRESVRITSDLLKFLRTDAALKCMRHAFLVVCILGMPVPVCMCKLDTLYTCFHAHAQGQANSCINTCSACVHAVLRTPVRIFWQAIPF